MSYMLGRRRGILRAMTDTSQNLVPGGKSLTGGKQHSPVLTLRVPAEMKDRLDALADAAGMGTSKYVRKILDDHLAGTD